jgi:thymidylate kinase
MELLFSAMRYENDRWLRNLEVSENPPDLVVSDRGWYSHLAYTDHNVSKDFTDLLYKGVIELETRLPEIVIYFRVNTETALKRRIKRGGVMDVIEMKGIEYQEKVRESFEEYIKEDNNDPSTGTVFFSVDANQDLDNVKSQLNNILEVIIDQYV